MIFFSISPQKRNTFFSLSVVFLPLKMEPSATSFKDNEKSATRSIGNPPEGYHPPTHYGGGGYPPSTGYAPPHPMAGYGGYASPPPPYGAYPPPYNAAPYAPQGYCYPHHPPPPPAGYGYGPPPAENNSKKKKKKKSGMGKYLGMGAGLVGGLLLGGLVADGGGEAPSFDSFSGGSGGGFDQLYETSMQSASDSMDFLGTIG